MTRWSTYSISLIWVRADVCERLRNMYADASLIRCFSRISSRTDLPLSYSPAILASITVTHSTGWEHLLCVLTIVVARTLSSVLPSLSKHAWSFHLELLIFASSYFWKHEGIRDRPRRYSCQLSGAMRFCTFHSARLGCQRLLEDIEVSL